MKKGLEFARENKYMDIYGFEDVGSVPDYNSHDGMTSRNVKMLVDKGSLMKAGECVRIKARIKQKDNPRLCFRGLDYNLRSAVKRLNLKYPKRYYKGSMRCFSGYLTRTD